MPAYDDTIRIGLDSREAIRGIDNLSKKLRGVENLGKINARNFTQPLGKITGAANEFQKSMEAANARVLAFGAAAGTIYQVQRAFTELVKSTIEVEYSLAKINTLLKQTSGNLANTSKGLFQVAKNTGQSFETVATAMEEFARQGLTAEQALKRTRDAMVLVRLTGMDANSAVMSLTAAVNGFAKAGLDTTTVMNKMSKVASNFAVAERDLAEAVRRVGSSAVDAGVSFDELMAAVTSAQQVTARGGAVIGNSFKTIFTRLQRLRNIKALEEIGIQVRDMNGNIKPAMGVLKALAKEFDNLKDVQRAQVAELIGGVFQVNVLKAVMSDLSNEMGIYSRAVKMSNAATDEAIRKNQQLNVTIKSLLNETKAAFDEMAAGIGGTALDKPIKRVLSILKFGMEKATPGEGKGFGETLGRGILSGLGDFLAGPGLVMIAAVIGKLMAKFTKFAMQSLQSMTAVGKATQQRAMMEAEITALLAKDTQLMNLLEKETVDVEKVQKRILLLMNQQIRAQETLAAVAARAAPAVMKGGVRPVSGGGVARAGGSGISAGGYVPRREATAERGAAAAGGYKAGNVRSMTVPGFGRMVYNSAETVAQFPGFAQPAIMPPKGSSAGGAYAQSFRRSHGFNPYSAAFTPGFAKKPAGPVLPKHLKVPVGSNKKPHSMLQFMSSKGAILTGRGKPKADFFGAVAGTGATSPIPVMNDPRVVKMMGGTHPVPGLPKNHGLHLGAAYGAIKGIPSKTSKSFEKAWGPNIKDPAYKDEIDSIENGLSQYASKIGQEIFGPEMKVTKQDILSAGGMKGLLGEDTKGNLFEGAVRATLNSARLKRKQTALGGADSYMDFNATSAADPELVNWMGIPEGSKVEAKVSAKAAEDPGGKIVKKWISDDLVGPSAKTVVNALEKAFEQEAVKKYKGMQKGKGKALGFIPNFADPNRMREAKQAGVSYGQTYYADVTTPNFSGTVVGNRRDEPTMGALKKAVMNHPNPAMAGLAAGGHVPGFAFGLSGPYDERSRERLGHRDAQRRHTKALDKHTHTLNQGQRTVGRGGVGNPYYGGGRGTPLTGAPAWRGSRTGLAIGQGLGNVKHMAQGFGNMMGGNAGLGLMFIAPMVAGAINEALQDQGTIGRGIGATTVGIGQAISFGAMASMLGGMGGDGGAGGAAAKTKAKPGFLSKMGTKLGQTRAGQAASRFGAKQVAGKGIIGGIARGVGMGAARGAGAGPWGIAAGAALGLLMEMPNIIKAFSDTSPEFNARMKEMTEKNENFVKAAVQVIDIQGKLITATNQMSDAQRDLLRDQLEVSMGELTPKLREQVNQAYAAGDITGAQTAIQRGIMVANANQRSVQLAENVRSMTSGKGNMLDADDGMFGSGWWNLGWDASMDRAGKERMRTQARSYMTMTNDEGRTLRGMLKEDEGLRDEFRAVAEAFKSQEGEMWGQGQLDAAINKFGNFLDSAGINETQQAEMMKQMREGASEASLTGEFFGLFGLTKSDRDKLGKMYEGQGEEMLKLLESMADQGKIEEAEKKFRQTSAQLQSHIYDMSESFRESVARIEIDSKTFIVAISGISRRLTQAENHFIKMSSLQGAGPLTMNALQGQAGINQAQRSAEIKDQQAMQNLRAGIAAAIGGTMMTDLGSSMTKLMGSGGKGGGGPLNPEQMMNVSKGISQDMQKEMANFEEAFKQGPKVFMSAITSFKTAIKKEQDAIVKLQVEGKQITSEEQTQLNINKNNLQKVNSELDKFTKSVLLNKAQLVEEIAARKQAIELQKDLINLQQKLNIGGGMQNVMNLSPTALQNQLGQIGSARRYGTNQEQGAAFMQQLDFLQSFGAEISPAARKQMSGYLEKHLDTLNDALGLSVIKGRTGDVAQKMVANRYKTETDQAKLVAQLNQLTPTMESAAGAMEASSEGLTSWLNDQKAPRVKIDNIQAIAEAIRGKSPITTTTKKGQTAVERTAPPPSTSMPTYNHPAPTATAYHDGVQVKVDDVIPNKGMYMLVSPDGRTTTWYKDGVPIPNPLKPVELPQAPTLRPPGANLPVMPGIPLGGGGAVPLDRMAGQALGLALPNQGGLDWNTILGGLPQKPAGVDTYVLDWLNQMNKLAGDGDVNKGATINMAPTTQQGIAADFAKVIPWAQSQGYMPAPPPPATITKPPIFTSLPEEPRYETTGGEGEPPQRAQGTVTGAFMEILRRSGMSDKDMRPEDRYSPANMKKFRDQLRTNFGTPGLGPKMRQKEGLYDPAIASNVMFGMAFENAAKSLAEAGIHGEQFNNMLQNYSTQADTISNSTDELHVKQAKLSRLQQKLAREIAELTQRWQTLSSVLQKEGLNMRGKGGGNVGTAFEKVISGMTPEVKGNTLRDFVFNQAGQLLETLTEDEFKKFGKDMEAAIQDFAKGTKEWPDIMHEMREKIRDLDKFPTVQKALQRATGDVKTGRKTPLQALQAGLAATKGEAGKNTLKEMLMGEFGGWMQNMSAADATRYATTMQKWINTLDTTNKEWPVVLQEFYAKLREADPWATREKFFSDMQKDFRSNAGKFAPVLGPLPEGGNPKQNLENFFRVTAYNDSRTGRGRQVRSFQDMVMGEAGGLVGNFDAKRLTTFGEDMDKIAKDMKEKKITWGEAIERFRKKLDELKFEDIEKGFAAGSVGTSTMMKAHLDRAMQTKAKGGFKYTVDQFLDPVSGLMGGPQNQADRRQQMLAALEGSMAVLEDFRAIGGIDDEVLEYKNQIIATSKLYEQGNLTYEEFLSKIEQLNRNIDPALTEKTVKKLKTDLADRKITESEYMEGIQRLGSARRFKARQAGKSAPGGFGHGFSTAMTMTPLDRFEMIERQGAQFAEALSSNMSSAFMDIIKGAKDAKEALRDFSLAMLDTMFKMATEQFFRNIFNAAWGVTTGGVARGANGGLIKKFNTGGMVSGGSGTRDDVPAMMSAGEFVIRKGSVQKYGRGFMEQLNQGVVSASTGGAMSTLTRKPPSDSELTVFKERFLDPMHPKVSSMSLRALKKRAQYAGAQRRALGGVLLAGVIGAGLYGAANQPDAEEHKRSDMAGHRAYGSQELSETEFRRGFAAQTSTKINRLEKGIDSLAANAAIMQGSDPRRPTGVREVTGLGVTHSARAYGGGGAGQTPLDKMREARMQAFSDYEKGIEEFEKLKTKAMEAYKRRKKSVIIQGITTAAMQVANQYIYAANSNSGVETPNHPVGPEYGPGGRQGGDFSKGPQDTLYVPPDPRLTALGGHMHKDNIPALLMGGEYVINKRAVDKIGVPTLNAINRGTHNPHIRRFAQGGYVAPDTGGAAPMGTAGGEETLAHLKDLVTATTEVKDAIQSLGMVMTQPTMQGQGLEAQTVGAAAGGGQTNNISISVNMEGGTRQASGNTTDDAGNEEAGKKENQQQMEGFAELLETAVMKVIMEQKRPGGLLYDPNNRSNY